MRMGHYLEFICAATVIIIPAYVCEALVITLDCQLEETKTFLGSHACIYTRSFKYYFADIFVLFFRRMFKELCSYILTTDLHP